MPFLKRTKLRPSHLLLPLFYLVLGASLGWVFPVMFHLRPGKGELEKQDEFRAQLAIHFWSAAIVERLNTVVFQLQAQGLLVVRSAESGLGAGWTAPTHGDFRIGQSWSFRLLSPPLASLDPSQRQTIASALFALNSTTNGIMTLKVTNVKWDFPDTVTVEYTWILRRSDYHAPYQTTNLPHELSW